MCEYRRPSFTEEVKGPDGYVLFTYDYESESKAKKFAENAEKILQGDKGWVECLPAPEWTVVDVYIKTKGVNPKEINNLISKIEEEI